MGFSSVAITLRTCHDFASDTHSASLWGDKRRPERRLADSSLFEVEPLIDFLAYHGTVEELRGFEGDIGWDAFFHIGEGTAIFGGDRGDARGGYASADRGEIRTHDAGAAARSLARGEDFAAIGLGDGGQRVTTHSEHTHEKKADISVKLNCFPMETFSSTVFKGQF